jgi:putative sterol carrier protein
VVGAALGADADADVTLTTTYADSVSILQGELDANAAFMQGRVKVVGDMGRLLPLMKLGRTPAHEAARAALAAETEL